MKQNKPKHYKPSHAAQFLRQHGIALWLALVVLALLVTSSAAAYTSITSTKHVVSPQQTEVLFSSNYLSSYASGALPSDVKDWSGNLLSLRGTDRSIVSVRICNYGQTNSAKHNEKDITYTFQLELLDAQTLKKLDDNTTFTVNDKTVTATEIAAQYSLTCNNVAKSFTNYACTVSSQTLSGSSSSYDLYQISVPNDYADLIKIKITATPDSASQPAAGYTVLASVLSTSVYQAISNVGWSGDFSDDAAFSDPKLLDAFNYEISGSGIAAVTLSWNASYVTLSPWSVEELKSLGLLSDDDDNRNDSTPSVTLQMTSTSTERYSLQFFRTAGIPSDETVDSIKSYVNLTVSESTKTDADENSSNNNNSGESPFDPDASGSEASKN
jgi:hypothetical protein